MDLPLEYRWITAQKFQGFLPWMFQDPNDMENQRKEYQLETGLDLIPFAKRQDREDIAGFEVCNGQVNTQELTVHLTWSGKNESGNFPITMTSENIFEWIKFILIPSTLEYMNEADLMDLENI